jgi:hypothetical protein
VYLFAAYQDGGTKAMPSNAKIRIVKRNQQQPADAGTAAASAARPTPADETARTVRMVVSDWVREHQQRAAEFRNNYASLLKEVGFNTPSNCVRC